MRGNSPCSRADLVRLSGLSAPTVSAPSRRSRKKNLVERLGLGTSNGGRRPDLLRFNSKYGFVAGVDIGGSNLRLVLADLDGTILGRWTANTRVHRTPAKIVDLIHHGLFYLLRQHGLSDRNLLAIAAGAPGVTDVKRGIVISAPHLMNWDNVPLRSLLEGRFKVPTVVENDVNAAAVGERWRGAAQGVDDFLFSRSAPGSVRAFSFVPSFTMAPTGPLERSVIFAFRVRGIRASRSTSRVRRDFGGRPRHRAVVAKSLPGVKR